MMILGFVQFPDICDEQIGFLEFIGCPEKFWHV